MLEMRQSEGAKNAKPKRRHLLMHNDATNRSRERFWVWIIWLVVLTSVMTHAPSPQYVTTTPLLGVSVEAEKAQAGLFPWQRWHRVKKWAYRKYKDYQARYRQAKGMAQLAKVAKVGLMSLATVVDSVIRSQVRYKLGALPVLYALLEILEVRESINRHCKSQAEVDHGTVALVLGLNRLMLPLPLSQIADWVGQTVLTAELGIPASKFNDDRLARTLDALYEKLGPIWMDIVNVAIRKGNLDLSVIFYDVTAFVAHGHYSESELIDFGFAHNTPSDKRKGKVSLDVSADGNIPCIPQLWSGRTADQATVATNLDNLAQWLCQHGQPLLETLIVGDRAMLNAELAIAYDEKGLRHLTGLKTTAPEHKQLIACWRDEQFAHYPIVAGANPQYWGRGCQVTLTHEDKAVTHKGLVVLAGPLRDALRQARHKQFEALDAELTQLRERLGQPRFNSRKAVQRSVKARLKKSAVAQFLLVDVQENPAPEETSMLKAQPRVSLQWRINQQALAAAERKDGRYLLVTNDYALSHSDMFRLYRQKDGVETCFHVLKSDLKLSPLFLHKDTRISAMIFINMVALLAYNMLQHQVTQQGLHMTTRRIIAQLDTLVVIETLYLDGSCSRRMTDVPPEILSTLSFVSLALCNMVHHLSLLSDTHNPHRLALPPSDPLLLASP
jgi:transposase